MIEATVMTAPLKELAAKELIAEFKSDCELRNMSKESLRRYLSDIRIYCRFMEDSGRDILRADKKTMRAFLAYLLNDRKVSLKSVKNYFSSLSSFYDYLIYEDYIDYSPVGPVRKKYVRSYKKYNDSHTRKLISSEDMANLINSTLDVRDKAITTLLAKTGIRRNELITLDVDDVDFVGQKITLKPTAKRSNKTVFFDGEASIILQRWVRARQTRNKKNITALFISARGNRIGKNQVYDAVVGPAKAIGLYNPSSDKLEDHFHPHCCRHWFTTELRKAGMPREFIQELRGDARKAAVDIYDHIDENELRESYLANIPQLGI